MKRWLTLAAFALLAVCLRLGLRIGVAYGSWGAAGVTVTAVLSAVRSER
jgi:small multidrug resistance pump